MPTRTCIYCLRDLDASAFNVEHVVPRAFGLFDDNLTLSCVCRDCNSYFGETLELAYARDSLEAFLRLIHGVKSPREARDLPRVRLTVTLGEDEDWKGCWVELGEENGRFAVELVPQVRFASRRGGWIFVREDTLADTEQPLPAEVDTGGEIRLFSNSEEVTQRLKDCLASRGIPFVQHAQSGPPPSRSGRAPLDVEMRFDAVILRCVGKIAFNYMAAVAGCDFARSGSFDRIRRLIRYNEQTSTGPTDGAPAAGGC